MSDEIGPTREDWEYPDTKAYSIIVLLWVGGLLLCRWNWGWSWWETLGYGLFFSFTGLVASSDKEW